MTIKDVVDQFTAGEFFENERQKIEIARKKIFDFPYPIFDDAYKKIFETNFIRRFYMREIGFETDGLFKFQLETWLLIHMPYFNKMFESELLEFDPLTNMKSGVKHTKINDRLQNDKRDVAQSSNTEGESSGKTDNISNSDSTGTRTTDSDTTGDNFNRTLQSDTPDSRLSITPTNDGTGVIEYASKIDEEKERLNTISSANENTENKGKTIDNATSTSDTSVSTNANQNEAMESKINDIEDFVMERFGKIGVQSYSKMVMEFRQSFVRIEKQIFNEMQELFMLVY